MEDQYKANTVLNPELKYEGVSYYGLAALRKLKSIGRDTTGFDVYGLHGMTGGTEVTVGPVTTYKKGPRKGKTKYGSRKDCHKVLVTHEDMLAEKANFIAETGRCGECQGNGLTWAGWSKDEGNRFRKCGTCNGTGLAKGVEDEAV